LQKPNEIEDETPARSNKTERLKREEKILIETKPELLLEKCNLNLSDDFSSLVEQFKQHLSPCTNTKFPKKDIDIFQHRKKELSVNTSQEKIQVEEQQTPSKQANVENNFLNPTTPITKNTRSRNNSHSSSKNTKKNNGIHSNNNNDSSTNLFNSIPTSSTSSPRSGKMSRRTSASSKKSQKSVKTTRQRSQRRHKHHQKQDKYVERSYDEMMRIPDIFERVSFYEKTLDLCLQVESPIANWIKKNSAKGLPKPLTEGRYIYIYIYIYI
jgi:hypothetical protein